MVAIKSLDSIEVYLSDRELVKLREGIEKKVVKSCLDPCDKKILLKFDGSFSGGLNIAVKKDFFEFIIGNSGYQVLHDHTNNFRSIGAMVNDVLYRIYVTETKKIGKSYFSTNEK